METNGCLKDGKKHSTFKNLWYTSICICWKWAKTCKRKFKKNSDADNILSLYNKMSALKALFLS